MKKLRNKGKTGKTKSGRLVLINGEGQIFPVDNVAVSIWYMCDGTVTSEDLVKEISQKTEQKESAVREMVDRLVGVMEKVGLMESIE